MIQAPQHQTPSRLPHSMLPKPLRPAPLLRSPPPDPPPAEPPQAPPAEPPEATGGFKNLTKQKAQIGGRINDSIAAFTDPIGYQLSILKGGNNNKTKRLVKRNKKSRSRRVRFSF